MMQVSIPPGQCPLASLGRRGHSETQTPDSDLELTGCHTTRRRHGDPAAESASESVRPPGQGPGWLRRLLSGFSPLAGLSDWHSGLSPAVAACQCQAFTVTFASAAAVRRSELDSLALSVPLADSDSLTDSQSLTGLRP
eukprot:230981-Rhodomonas_salina.2